MILTARIASLAACLTLIACAAPAQAGLVALYTYDTPGNLGLDSSGKGNNLLNSGATSAATGKYGAGLELGGSAMLYSATGTLVGLPTGDSSYTIATWMNPDSAGDGGAGGMVGWGAYGNNSMVNALRMLGNNGVHNYWWANDLSATVSIDLTSGSGALGWHFVAATYDNVTDFQRIYIDGVMVSERTATGHNAQASNFAVGKTVNSEFFDGQLDNTSIFDQALTAAQLMTIASGNFTAFGVNAVPEPATTPLLLAGLALMGLQAARRRRS